MTALTKVLRTDVMADLDLKALAQILRSHGRGRDTVLAHITPREAKMLKEQGGSGTINPATGLPEFQEMDFGMFAEAPAQAFEPGGGYQAYTMPVYSEGAFTQEQVPGGPGGGPQQLPEIQLLSGQQPGGQAPFTAGAAQGPSVRIPPSQLNLTPPQSFEAAVAQPSTPQTTEPPGYFSRLGTALQTQLSDPGTLARLGLGLGIGGLGALQAQRGAQAARRSRAELSAIGEPYRRQGQELIEQARRGELSPASAQAMQAAQARMAQATAGRGGVGAMQGAANLERLRAQLLQSQYQLGLNVANIGDQYLRGAIQSGLQANQALQTATNQFYGVLGSVLAGPTGQAVASAARV